MTTSQEIFELFTSTIDMKYALKEGNIIWLDETWKESKTPRSDINWFVKALANDPFYEGNYLLYAFAQKGLGADVMADMMIEMPYSIVKTKQETIAEVIENFKKYLFEIYVNHSV
jgi:hypothetical protein